MKTKYTSLTIVGAIACDYLTVASWNKKNCQTIFNYGLNRMEAAKMSFEVKPKGYQQYVGVEAQGIFFGEGMQGGVSHYLVTAKGGYAEMILPIALEIHRSGDGVNCTNIHLQMTTDAQTTDLKSSYELLTDEAVQWRGRRVKCRVIVDTGGLNSLYIGRQVGDYYAIIYIKEFGQNERGTRFEGRFRRGNAQEVFSRLAFAKNVKSEMMGIIKSKWLKYPEDFEEYLKDMYEAIPLFGVEANGYTINSNSDLKRKFAWFATCVSPAVQDLLISEYSEDTEKILIDLLRYSAKIK